MEENYYEKIINAYYQDKENLLPILDEIQEYYKCIPQNAIMYLAKYLGLKEQYILTMIKFYKKYTLESKGKNIITICKGNSCIKNKSLDIEKFLKEKLKIGINETTSDKMFTLEQVNCFGRCAKSPVVKINDDIYEKVTIEKLKEILDKIK